MRQLLGMSVLASAMLVCLAYAGVASVPKDGQLALPADYQQWPPFLTGIQRADVNQVRDIYINPVGTKTAHGQAFPDGTILVMELYRAKTGPNGTLEKGELSKVFVMGKHAGWGQDVPEKLKNGTWVFAAYDPGGKPLAEDFTKCRTCHAPVAQNDFVHRYDEYFQARGHVH